MVVVSVVAKGFSDQHLFSDRPLVVVVIQGVFGLTFGFGFCPLKAKPKGWIQEATFFKSQLSRSTILKASLNLL
jgi:hypothetical protein